MPYKSRQTARLRTGRDSLPSAWYFLTWCTARRVPFLADESIRLATRQAIDAIDESGDGHVLCATLMPDHIHLLLELGSRLTVSQVVAKTKSAIKRACPTIGWQLNFFEHRLRDPASAEDYALYIFMNPYCAQLCSLDEVWPGWISSDGVRWMFETKLRARSYPQPEWVDEALRFSTLLPEGAD